MVRIRADHILLFLVCQEILGEEFRRLFEEILFFLSDIGESRGAPIEGEQESPLRSELRFEDGL